jgi:hypothetical protein
MGYRVKPVFWLKTEADRVEAIILLPKFWSVVWTAATLREKLAELGLDYSPEQIDEIGAELVLRGVVEAT